jgi:hypothetical protein
VALGARIALAAVATTLALVASCAGGEIGEPCQAGNVTCEGEVAVVCEADGTGVSRQDCAESLAYCVTGQGCVPTPSDYAVDLRAAFADDDSDDAVGLVVALPDTDISAWPFASRRLFMRPVTVELSGGWQEGAVTLSASDSAIEVYREDGTLVAFPATFEVGLLPLGLLVLAPEGADGLLRAVFNPPTGEPAEDALRVRATRLVGLAGRSLGSFPHLDIVDTFNDDEEIAVGLDPARFPDRVGLPYDVHVVAHRTPEEWASNPALDDASGEVESASVSEGSLADNRAVAWSGGVDDGEVVGTGYDVVFDFGRDGSLDPGDLCDGLAERPGLHVVRDLNLAGPHVPLSVEYSGTDIWLQQRTYYPEDIASLGELPLVIVSHGNGHDYTMYDYLGNHLASHGYVVMAHSNNTMPGVDSAATTTLTNTDYLLGSLATIAGGVLDGHVQIDNVAWIGHSRGGEGVVIAYDRLRDGVVTPTNFQASDIVVISSIAPTVFNSVDVSNPHDVNYHLLAGAADGDVNGHPACDVCQFFRLSQAAVGEVSVTYVQGASHNDFNCCGPDDGTGPALIGRAEAQTLAKSYYLALVEHYLRDNPAMLEYFTRPASGFRPSGIAGTTVVTNGFRHAIAAGNYFLDDYQAEEGANVASSGAAIEFDVAGVVEGRLADGDFSLFWGDDAMNGMTQAYSPDPLDLARGVVFEWTASSFYEIAVPGAAVDFSAWRHLSLRACQRSQHPNTVTLAGPLAFSVTLIDGEGTQSSINLGQYGDIAPPYARDGGWANEFQTLRVRLSDFEVDGSGIDLTNIVRVRLEFGGDFGSATGALGLDDVELTP